MYHPKSEVELLYFSQWAHIESEILCFPGDWAYPRSQGNGANEDVMEEALRRKWSALAGNQGHIGVGITA